MSLGSEQNYMDKLKAKNTPAALRQQETPQVPMVQITERLLREEQEKREQAKNWLKQDAYRKAPLFKKIWMCLQYIYTDIRGEKHMPAIPTHLRKEMARSHDLALPNP